MKMVLFTIVSLLSEIAVDTLQKPDQDGIRRWDRMKLTMLVSFAMAIAYSVYSLINEGFRFDIFMVWIGGALGNKIIDAQSKRLEK